MPIFRRTFLRRRPSSHENAKSKPALSSAARGRLVFERCRGRRADRRDSRLHDDEGCGVRPPPARSPRRSSWRLGYDSARVRAAGSTAGRPVYSYGSMKWQRKQVGITATQEGEDNRRGRHAPISFGTVLYILATAGRVEDRGGTSRPGAIGFRPERMRRAELGALKTSSDRGNRECHPENRDGTTASAEPAPAQRTGDPRDERRRLIRPTPTPPR